MASRRLLAVCGPSGVGKGTIINQLLGDFPAHYSFATSHTTRRPRKGEKDGIEYHFVPEMQFEEMVENGEFVVFIYVSTVERLKKDSTFIYMYLPYKVHEFFGVPA